MYQKGMLFKKGGACYIKGKSTKQGHIIVTNTELQR